MSRLEDEDKTHHPSSLPLQMDSTDIHSARPQTAGEAVDSVAVQTEAPDSTRGEDKLPVMEPGKTTDTAAGQDEQGPRAGHNDDTKYLEFYGEKPPRKQRPKAVKAYKRILEEFGSVDEAVRRQHELLELSRINIGQVTIKKEEVTIKLEEDEEY